MSNSILFVNPNQQIGTGFHMNGLNKIIGDNVKRLRLAAGMSWAELAREIDVKSANTIAAIEAGGGTKHLNKIARALKVRVADIDPTAEGEETVIIPRATGNDELLNVFASAEGGDGNLVWSSSEPYKQVPMPVPLIGVRGGYGVLIVGESMVPLIRPGYTVWVDPHKPARSDDLCLFLHDDHGDFRATIKQYCGQVPDGWLVKRYQPKERKYTLSKREWPVCHVVVGVDYGR